MLWLDNDDPQKARFVRKRLELPLKAGAETRPGDAENNAWGTHATLSIGEQADAFQLPSHDELEIDLDEYRGSPTLIIDYRAHW